MSDAFTDVLSGCVEACNDMDLNDDSWMPTPGNYTVQLEKIQTGTKEKNGLQNAWVKPFFSIVDGEFEGKSFTDYYWITPNPDKPSPALRSLCRLATCISGSEVKNPVDAINIAQDAEGEFLSVEVFQKEARNGKTYTNIRFLSRIDSTEEADG